jgi:dihydroorotase
VSAVLVRGGRVVDPRNRVDAPRDVLIENGRVAAVEQPGALDARAKKARAKIVDASGLVVAPGLIDIHVHLREPGQTYKETIATGTAAAIAGGVTTVCAMPNTVPVNDSAELTAWMMAAERGAQAKVFAIAAATVGSNGEKLTDYAALKRAGAVAVSDDGRPILGDAIMRAALKAAAKVGIPVVQHAEDTRLTGGVCAMHAGALSFRLGLRGMTNEAEAGIVARDIKLLEEIDDERARLHVAHVSTAEAVAHVRRAKRRGLRVSCEVTPHHFTLTESAVEGYDTNAKMNPPLGGERDREALIEALLDGTVDAIATDHAPHAQHEKEQEFERAPNGITGLETSLGLTLQVMCGEHGMSLRRAIALMTQKPAEVMGLDGRGHLGVGAVGDVVVFDPNAEWEFDAGASRSRSRNTPFGGWKMRGAIRAVLVNGAVQSAK